LWGEWSGNDFKVYARFYNNETLTASKSLTASADVSLITCGAGSFSGGVYNCTATVISEFTIGGENKSWEIKQKPATATPAYVDGWKAARNAITPKTITETTRTIYIPGADPEAAAAELDLNPVFEAGKDSVGTPSIPLNADSIEDYDGNKKKVNFTYTFDGSSYPDYVIVNIGKYLDLNVTWGEASWNASGVTVSVTVNGHQYSHTYNE